MVRFLKTSGLEYVNEEYSLKLSFSRTGGISSYVGGGGEKRGGEEEVPGHEEQPADPSLILRRICEAPSRIPK